MPNRIRGSILLAPARTIGALALEVRNLDVVLPLTHKVHKVIVARRIGEALDTSDRKGHCIHDGSDLICEQHYVQKSQTRIRLQFLQEAFENTALIITALSEMHMCGLRALDAAVSEALILF